MATNVFQLLGITIPLAVICLLLTLSLIACVIKLYQRRHVARKENASNTSSNIRTQSKPKFLSLRLPLPPSTNEYDEYETVLIDPSPTATHGYLDILPAIESPDDTTSYQYVGPDIIADQ